MMPSHRLRSLRSTAPAPAAPLACASPPPPPAGAVDFLPSIGWIMGTLGIVEYCLPYIAFAITSDWVREFDCWGMSMLNLDMAALFAKAFMYLMMDKMSNSCTNVIESVVSSCMGLCLTGGVLLGVYAQKKYPHHPKMLPTAITISILWIVAIGIFMAAMQNMWEFKERHTVIFMLGLLIIQAWQAVEPIRSRLCGNFIGDPGAVIVMKCAASSIMIITTLYEGWAFANNMPSVVKDKPHLSRYHWIMCIISAAIGGVQIVTRTVAKLIGFARSLYVETRRKILDFYRQESTRWRRNLGAEGEEHHGGDGDGERAGAAEPEAEGAAGGLEIQMFYRQARMPQ